MKKIINNQGGYIALIAILIIVVVTLAIGITLNILSISEAQSGLAQQQAVQSSSIADTCLDEAYLRIERDSGYSGGSLNIGQGSCNITVVTSAPNERIITVESNVDDIIKRIESEVDISTGEVQVNYWQELK